MPFLAWMDKVILIDVEAVDQLHLVAIAVQSAILVGGVASACL